MSIKWVGYYFVSNDDKSVTIHNSEGLVTTSSNPKELLDFLYIPYREEYTREVKYVYDIDDSMSLIFRLLTPEQCKGILNTKNGGSYNLFDYEVSYSRERNFIVRGKTYQGNHQYWSCLYHLKQYFKHPIEPKNIKELSEMGLKVQNALINIGIPMPTTLNSAISIWESSMRKTESIMIPNVSKFVPPEHTKAIEFAEKCAQHQGFITACKIGHFKQGEVYSYDISSAYGFWLSQARDFKDIELTRYTPDYPYKHLILSGDVTGYFECELTINPDVKIHPYAYKDLQGNLSYRTGTFPTNLVLEEILSIIRNKKGAVKVLDGYYVRFKNRGKPMLNIINRLFQQRSLGEIEDILCKSIIVQMVGKSLMVNKDTGEPSQTYNPFLVAWVYAMCRLQDYEFILKNNLENDVVAICTDEVISTKKAEITKIEMKKIMGSWRQKEPSPMIILSPGWVVTKDKTPHSTSYETLTKLIKDDPYNNQYEITSSQRITLYKAVEELNNISKVGEMYEATNSLDLVEIRAKQDRLFKKFPHNGNELLINSYNSEPMKAD